MYLLIADDSKTLRESIKARLSDISGITDIFEAGSCRETICMIEKCLPDIVILDMQLGDGTGFHVMEKLRSKLITTTIIVFTSFDYPQYREKALSLGAYDFISKSNDETLFNLLQELTLSNET